MLEPVTLGVGAAVTAYLGKDGVNKILGPTAEYLGVAIKDFAQKRIENVGNIFGNAEKKLGEKINTPGQVPPKVLKTILDEGSYSDDSVTIEYFGGVLASSRTESGRDDRGARIGKILDNLSVYQIRTHYILYTIIRKLFKDSGRRFSQEDRRAMKLFIPFDTYVNSMELSDLEQGQFISILNNTFFGLNKDALISDFYYGPIEHIQKEFKDAHDGGIVVGPSALGAELYLWGYGFGDKDLDFILKNEEFEDLIDVPINIENILIYQK